MNTRLTTLPAVQAGGSQQPSPVASEQPSLHYFWKGRVALYAILKALGIGTGDRILIPGYTCVVVPAAAYFLGAEPVYVDIDSDTYNVSLARIHEIYEQQAGLIKAVVIQHTYGMPVDTAPIVAWAKAEGIAVIEDCCHAIGSRYVTDEGEWKEVGTLGDAAFFSSQWSKPISTGLGGWALTRSAALAEKLGIIHDQACVQPSLLEQAVLAGQVAVRSLFSWPGSYWLAQTMYRFLSRRGLAIGSSVEAELQGEMPDNYAKQMSFLQRQLLSRKMRKIETLIRHRLKLRDLYDLHLSQAGFPCFEAPTYAQPVLLRYPVRIGNKDEVLEKARKEGVELGDWFDNPLHPKESNRELFGYRNSMCTNGEEAACEVINLPMHEQVTDHIAEKTVLFLSRNAKKIK